MRPLCLACFALVLITAKACTQEPAAPPAAPAKAPEFTRFVDLGDYRGRLEVSVARYTDAKQTIEVDLVSAVHVGEAAYYADLVRRFKGYDAVLYELVAPADTVPDPDAKERGFNPVSALQQGMKRMLQLEFQLEGIDYQQKNFVHADLSPDDIARLWRERGESLMSTLLKMMMGSAKMQQERYEEAAEKLEAAGGEVEELPKPRGRQNIRRAMKWNLARELGPMEEMLAMFGDDDKGSGSVLIGERNKRAVEVLQREIKAGKRKLAIFYGAAHMPDMAQRLVKEIGLQRVSEEWVVAWNVDDVEKDGEKNADAPKGSTKKNVSPK